LHCVDLDDVIGGADEVVSGSCCSKLPASCSHSISTSVSGAEKKTTSSSLKGEPDVLEVVVEAVDDCWEGSEADVFMRFACLAARCEVRKGLATWSFGTTVSLRRLLSPEIKYL